MFSCVLPPLGGHWSMSTLRKSMSMPLVPLPRPLKVLESRFMSTQKIGPSSDGENGTHAHNIIAHQLYRTRANSFLLPHIEKLNRSMVPTIRIRDDSAMIKVADIERQRERRDERAAHFVLRPLPSPIDCLTFLFDSPHLFFFLLLLWASCHLRSLRLFHSARSLLTHVWATKLTNDERLANQIVSSVASVIFPLPYLFFFFKGNPLFSRGCRVVGVQVP